MLSLEEIGQSVRNNIQLILDNIQLPLAVGPISDDDYRILCGGFGQLEWDYALATMEMIQANLSYASSS